MTNRVITFHILLAAQFALIAVSMLVNVKTGLFSMVLILLFTAICLIQLSNDERTNWKPGQNIMTYLFIVWLLFYVAEILNPNNVMAAWNINLTPYALIPLICAFVVPVVIRTKKDVELLLIIWSIFVIIFTLKGYWQKIMVSAPKTFISCMYWEAHALTLYGRESVTSPASQMPQTMGYTLPCRQSPSPLLHFLLIRDGSVSTSFLSLFAVFTEWGFPEPVLPWVFLWVVC